MKTFGVFIGIVIILGIALSIFIIDIPREAALNSTENLGNSPNTPSVEMPNVNSELEREFVVSMVDYDFVPDELTIKKGDTVKWVNNGKGVHYVLSVSGKRVLDSKNIKVGESYSYTFEETGTYGYFSPVYQVMQAKIIVE